MIWNGSSWMEVNQFEPEFQKASEEDEKANWNQLNEVEKKDIEMSVNDIIPLLYNRNQKDYKKVAILQTKRVNDLMVKSVALQIQGYPIEEIRKIFKVEDPKWTLEELEELQKIKDENARRKEQERFEKIRVWNGSSWMEVNQVEPEFPKACKTNWNQVFNRLNG